MTTSTRSSVVAAFCLPPVWRGSTYVPRPDLGHEPRPPGGDLAGQLREDALRERVRLDLVGLDQRPEPRLVADVAADRPAHQPGQPELREAAVGEVADADDAHGGQVARPALGGEDGRELVDEALRDGVARARPADEQRAAVADQPDRLADLDDLGGWLTACTRRRSD